MGAVRRAFPLFALACCVLLCVAHRVNAQAAPADPHLAPRPDLAPALPVAPAPATGVTPGLAPAAPSGALAPFAPAPAPPVPARPAYANANVLFVCEGLDTLLSVPDLRAKLGDALGRELVSLVDPRAHRADATVWAALGEDTVVLRVTPPNRPEVWRQLPRASLGADPAAVITRAVLEMFWTDSFARLDAAEIQDPFCPPGLICVQANRAGQWPPFPEAEVLDPWDTSYQRFYGWDPFAYRYPSSAALAAPYPGRVVRAPGYTSERYYGARYAPQAALPPTREHPDDYALNLLIGGGVHGGGAFFRYEMDILRRFEPFDFGLAYVAARAQPEPPNEARRVIAAMLQRRYVASAFELDLGATFGTFFATFEKRAAEVRPYLRGNVTFALEVGRTFDLLVQSDLATTFVSVPETGVVEYTLSLGLRHRI